MKKVIATAIALFTLWFTVRADHHVAMDLTYKYTGVPDQYEITLNFYRDCDGMAMPSLIDICFRSVTCNFLGSVTLNRISGPSLVTWPDCVVRPPGAGGCNGGGVYDIQKAVFRGTLYLPYQCPDWQFEYVNCCRNYDITTINPAGTENIYIDARIDNLNFPVNSSPTFNTIPSNIWCLNKEQIFDPGTVETDGDSLVYELVTPRSLSNMVICDPANPAPYNVMYVNGYTPQNFMASANGIIFDPTTGVIKFTPSLLQVSVVDLKVKEYRNGQLIGSVIRSMQFFITPLCQTSIPQFVTSTVNGIADAVAGVCNDPSVTLTLDKNILCNSIASDGSDFLMTDPSGNTVPITGAIPHSCVPPFDNQVTIYMATPLVGGVSKIWSKFGIDNNTLVSECNDQLAIDDTVNIVVSPCTNIVATFTASDTSFCERTCIDFTDQSTNNPTSWQWSFPGAIPLTSTDQHPAGVCYNDFGTFDVQLIACNNSGCDTMTMPSMIVTFPVLVIPSVSLAGDTLMCSGAQYYQWYLNGTAIAGATSQTYVIQQPGTYYVLISDDNGCEAPSVPIVITGIDETFLLSAVEIYPMPFTDSFTVKGELLNSNEISLNVYDISGRLISTQQIKTSGGKFKHILDTRQWPHGILVMELLSGKNAIYRKITKVNN